MNQPDLIQPTTLDVGGLELADTIAELQRDGAIITGMARGGSNGSYRLSLCWPQTVALSWLRSNGQGNGQV